MCFNILKIIYTPSSQVCSFYQCADSHSVSALQCSGRTVAARQGKKAVPPGGAPPVGRGPPCGEQGDRGACEPREECNYPGSPGRFPKAGEMQMGPDGMPWSLPDGSGQECEFRGQRSLSQGLRFESGWGLWEDPRPVCGEEGGRLGWLQI